MSLALLAVFGGAALAVAISWGWVRAQRPRESLALVWRLACSAGAVLGVLGTLASWQDALFMLVAMAGNGMGLGVAAFVVALGTLVAALVAAVVPERYHDQPWVLAAAMAGPTVWLGASAFLAEMGASGTPSYTAPSALITMGMLGLFVLARQPSEEGG